MVGLAFPDNYDVAAKIGLIQEIYRHEDVLFETIETNIRDKMIDNPTNAAARRAGAFASSHNYNALVQQAIRETHEKNSMVQQLLYDRPDTYRVRERCLNACRQVIHIYMTGSGFD